MTKENFEEFAYRSIIRMILKNQFRPGDFLLETELAEKLNLSRTPVRHALGRLVAEGFLEKKPKKGCIIPLPSAEDAQQVFFARQAIESQAAASAALHATESEIKQLRELLKQQDDGYNSGDKEAYTLTNEKFHFSIAKASRNIYLERYCQHIFWRSNVYVFFFDIFYMEKIDSNRHHQTPYQHAQIIDAIANRAPERAESAMKEHIRRTYEMLFKPWER